MVAIRDLYSNLTVSYTHLDVYKRQKQFGNLAKETNTVIIPQNLGDLGGMITSGLSLYENLNKAKKNV